VVVKYTSLEEYKDIANDTFFFQH